MEKELSIKDLLVTAMEQLCAAMPCPSVTLIVCCEGANALHTPLYGFRNHNGKGEILHFSAPAETINLIKELSWDAATQRT